MRELDFLLCTMLRAAVSEAKHTKHTDVIENFIKATLTITIE